MSNKKRKASQPIEFFKKSLPKNIRWMHDWDPEFLQKLSPKDAQWLARFIREYHNGNVKKHDRWALHRKKELRQDCYRRKNAQNSDLMSILDANGRMDRVDPDPTVGDKSFASLSRATSREKPAFVKKR